MRRRDTAACVIGYVDIGRRLVDRGADFNHDTATSIMVVTVHLWISPHSGVTGIFASFAQSVNRRHVVPTIVDEQHSR